MSWFNKKKNEDDLDIPKLPELPDISEFDLPSPLPETPPGLKEVEIKNLPPIPPPSLPPIRPGEFALPPIARPFPEQKTVPTKPAISQVFKPSNYPVSSDFRKSEPIIRAEPIEGLGMKEISFGIIPKTMEMEQPPEFGRQVYKKVEPLYIRLDKFETTIHSFREIKNKVLEIEELLAKTKEIKMKEEKELEEWEKEIQGIKSRIDFIDNSIFNKID